MKKIPKLWSLKITPENKEYVNNIKIKQKELNEDLFRYNPLYVELNSYHDEFGNTNTISNLNSEISFEQFKQLYPMKEFILPKLWSIKNTEENDEVISKWFTEKLGRKPLDRHKESYYHYYLQDNNCCTDSVIKDGYTEISYEEFCKYVLKQQPFDDNWCIKQSCQKACDYFNDKFETSTFIINGGFTYLVNNQEDVSDTLDDNIPEDYREISEQEFIENVLNKKTMKKQTLTRNQLLELRNQFDCSDWTIEIDTILEDNLLTVGDNFIIPNESINLLNNNGTKFQIEAVKALGFNLSEPIDYDKLKCGSEVMIKYSGNHVDGIDIIDIKYPVDIILFKSPYIMNCGKFMKSRGHNSNITFHQNDKFCCFSSDTEIDYITEVISY
jgi:hypothetical protein